MSYKVIFLIDYKIKSSIRESDKSSLHKKESKFSIYFFYILIVKHVRVKPCSTYLCKINISRKLILNITIIQMK